jgi:ABC-2 type transport system permease protein
MNLRRLRTLVVREVRATLRDPFTVITLVAVPLVALLAFSSILATNVRGMQLGVFDASRSAISRRVVAELAAGGAFVPRTYATRESLEAALVRGDISTAVVFPPDLESAVARRRDGTAPEVQVIYDGAETVLAGNADAFLRSILAASGLRIVQRDVQRGEDGTVTASAPGAIQVSTRALFNPTLEGRPFMVAGTFGFVLSFLTVLITAVSIVNERLTGTFDQLQLTPATNAEILLGKLLPMGAVFSADVVLMVLVAGFVLGVWPAGSTVFFLVVASFYVAMSLSLGLIFSATSATPGEAVQKTVLFSVPLVQLSGFSFPVRNMPESVQWITALLPATHFIKVTRAIYLRGAGPLDLWPELLVLLAFGVVLVAIALRTLGRRS